MEIKLKFENQVNFSISENILKCFVLPDDNHKDIISLEHGVIFGEQHFGFTVKSDKKEKTEAYSTQCRVDSAEMVDGKLKVYEEGKMFPWVFKSDGTLVKSATFNELSRKDIDYVKEQVGDFPDKDIPKVLQKINSYKEGI